MGEAERIESAVRSFEDHLSSDLRSLDAWLVEGHRIRAELAQRLHTLRLATDPAVEAAVVDAERRVAENRPYEDALDVDELARRLRDVAPR